MTGVHMVSVPVVPGAQCWAQEVTVHRDIWMPAERAAGEEQPHRSLCSFLQIELIGAGGHTVLL